MKTIKNLFVAGTLLAIFSSSAMALPAWKAGAPFHALTTKADFESLEPGSQLVLVCKTSDTVTLIDIKNRKQAMALCTEGRMIHCSACKKKYRVVWSNPAHRGTPHKVMRIVNEKGEPCMFIARIK
jgi:hypothetical protein